MVRLARAELLNPSEVAILHVIAGRMLLRLGMTPKWRDIG